MVDCAWEKGGVSLNRVHHARSLKSDLEKLLQVVSVLIVDDNQFMRKVVRTLLMNVGVKNVDQVVHGIAALEHIRMFEPDLVILDLGIAAAYRA